MLTKIGGRTSADSLVGQQLNSAVVLDLRKYLRRCNVQCATDPNEQPDGGGLLFVLKLRDVLARDTGAGSQLLLAQRDATAGFAEFLTQHR